MSEYKPCPNCGRAGAERMSFTWWGGILGPKLLSHVKCGNCGTQYNGKTGGSNTTGIIIYTVIVVSILAALLVIGIAVVIMLAAMN